MKLKIQFAEEKAAAVPVHKLNLWGPFPVISKQPLQTRFAETWPHCQQPVNRRQQPLRASV